MARFTIEKKDFLFEITAGSSEEADVIAAIADVQFGLFLFQARLGETEKSEASDFDEIHGRLRQIAISNLRKWVEQSFPDSAIVVELLTLN